MCGKRILQSDNNNNDESSTTNKKQTLRRSLKRKCKDEVNQPIRKIPRTRSQTRKNKCDWTLLPPEIMLKIFSYASQSDMGAIPNLCRISKVCTSWWQISRTASLWTHVSFCYSELPTANRWRGNSKIAKSFKDVTERFFHRFKSIKFIGYSRISQELLSAVSRKCFCLSSIGFFNCTRLDLRTDTILNVLQNNKITLKSLKIKNSHIHCVSDNPFYDLSMLEELIVDITTSLLNKNFFNFSKMCHLTVLKISILGKSCFDMGQLEPLKKVQIVHITNTVLGLQEGAALKIEWPDLKELNLAFDDGLSISMHCDTIHLVYMLEKCNKLETLNLKNRTPTSLSKLSEICPSNCLRYLNISGFDGPGFKYVIRRWHNSLEELHMDNCHNFLDDLSEISDVYSLECLKLASFEKTSVTVGFLKKILQKYKSLTSINVKCCKQLPRQCQGLHSNVKLRSFKKKLFQ